MAEQAGSGTLWCKDTLKRELLWVAAIAGIYMLIHGYLMLRLGLHQDEVYDFCGEEAGLYAAAGRWGVLLWRYVFGEGASLYAAGITAGIATAITVVWQTKILKLDDVYAKLLYCAFYVGCTQYAHMIRYAFLSDVIAVAMLAVTAGIYYLSKPGKVNSLYSILLLAFALGTYQATCFYIAVLWFAYQLRMQQVGTGVNTWQELKKLCVVGGIALVLWWALKQATTRLPLVTEEHLSYAQSYQKSLTNWAAFTQGSWGDKLALLEHAFRYLFWSQLGRTYTGQWVYATALIPVALLAWHTWKQKGWATKLLQYGMLAMVWVLPHCLIFMLLKQQPPHTLLAEPLAVATLWGMSAAYLPQVLKKGMLVLIPFMLLKAGYRSADMAKTEAHEHELCIAELREIRSRGMATAAENQLPQKYKILIFGEPENAKVSVQLPCLYLMKFYLRTYKLNPMHIGSSQDTADNHAMLEQMPAWPVPGSVQHNGQDVIIKLGSLQ